MATWNLSDIPSQTGRTVVITGTGGLGYQDALVLVRSGAEVILAGRSPAKGAAAISAIRRELPDAPVSFEPLDLADLKSVHAFGSRMRREREHIDLLINNAGVMAPPRRMTTVDGYEVQFATNYLGHFALTGELLPLLRTGRDPRVVSVSSIAANNGVLNFADLQAEREYKPLTVYSQSKLANLLFARELQRRSDAGGWGIRSVAAHPGIARTELIANGAGRFSAMAILLLLLRPMVTQTAAQGALPTLFAATAPEATPGGYYGPDGLNELRGDPAPAKLPRRAADGEAAKRLWDLSEELVGVSFDAAARPAR